MFGLKTNKKLRDENNQLRSGLMETSALLANSLLGIDTDSGEPVSIPKAEKLTDVNTSLNILGESLAQTPKNVILETGSDKEIQKGHPVQALLNSKVGPNLTAFDFFYSVGWHVGSRGNRVAYISRQFDRTPTGFTLLDPNKLDIRMKDGKVFYFFESQEINPMDVLHFKGYSKNGLTGYSPILQNRELIGLALKKEKFEAKLYATIPPSYFTTEGEVKKEQRDAISEAWAKRDLGLTPVVSGGLALHKLGFNAQEAELGLSGQSISQKIYGIWRIPKILGQDYTDANFSNAVQQDLTFVKHNLLPRCERLDQELTDKLFTEKEKKEGLSARCNLKGFLKADPKTQNEAARLAIFTGMMSPKKWLESQGEDSGEAPDINMVQSNMIPVDMLESFIQSMIDKNKKGGPGNPSGISNGFKMNGNGEFV